METLLTHGLAAVGVGLVAATCFGFVIAHAIEEAAHTDETATRVACVGVLVVAVLLLGGYLKSASSACPAAPAYGQLDLRTQICKWSEPQSKIPTFPAPTFTLPGA